ncbi:MAG: DUF2510 domain-containing protein [Acidimicrobiales bacterium]|nr:DUF2510 domain-containing protein [Acidimicrobiales bacterium]
MQHHSTPDHLVETAARGRWWQPLADPELPPITAKRAYAEVLFIFAAFFATGIVNAALLLSKQYQNPFSSASWAVYGPQALAVTMNIGLAVVVVLLLVERRGVSPADLGLRWPRLSDGRPAVAQPVRVVAWAVLGLIVGGVINAALQSGHLPLGKASTPELLFGVFDSIQAGVIEELIVLAFVVITLRQAGRPWWEVTTVALVLRGSYHIYYGPGVAGILVWAAIYYWVYLRTRQLIPLMVCHAVWDTVGFLSTRWPAVGGVAVFVALAIGLAAPILWLTERNNKPPSQLPLHNWSPVVFSGFAPPPGWHPDPAGSNRWRWWDGERWTEHVSRHTESS